MYAEGAQPAHIYNQLPVLVMICCCNPRSLVLLTQEQLAACCLGSVEAVCGSPLAQWETLLDAHADELLQAACHDVTRCRACAHLFLQMLTV